MNFLTAYVEIKVELGKLKEDLAKASSLVTSTVTKMRSGLNRMASLFATAYRKVRRYAKWMALAIVGLGAAAVKLALNATESENLFTEAMGKMAESTRKWSEEMGKRLKMNDYDIRKMVGTLYVMTESMGLSSKEAEKMSQDLTELAYDMASFYNLQTEDAFAKIQSALVGMSRPMRNIGIIVDETTVKQWALTNGIVAEKEELTEIQKVRGRYNVMMERTTKAQGDYQRTMDKGMNTVKGFWANLKLVGIELGKVFEPSVTEGFRKMRDWLIENKTAVADFAQGLVDATKKGAPFREFIIQTVNVLEKMHKLFISLAAFGKSIGDLAAPEGKKQRMQKTFGGSWGNWGMDLDRGLDDKFISNLWEKTVIGSGSKLLNELEVIKNEMAVGPRMTPKDYQKLAEERGMVRAQTMNLQPVTDFDDAVSKLMEAPTEAAKRETELAKKTAEAIAEAKLALSRETQKRQARIAEDYAVAMANSWGDAFDKMTFEGEKFGDAMADMFRGLLRQIVNIMMYKKIAEPVAYGIMGIPMTSPGTPAHDAYLANKHGISTGHSGMDLRSDEAFAKVRKGEQILPRGSTGSDNVTVNMYNESQNQNLMTEASVDHDIDGMVISVLIKDEKNNGTFIQSLDSRYKK